MELIRLLSEHARARRTELVRTSLIGALADCSTVILLVHAADQALLGLFDDRALALFMVLLTIILISRRKTFVDTAEWLADFNHRLRIDLLGHVLRLDLVEYERIGRERIFAALASDTHVVAEAAEILANLLYMGMVLLIFFGYLLWLSPPTALVALAVFTTLSLIYRYNFQRAHALEEASAESEEAYFDALAATVKGFKELKLHRGKREAFYQEGFAESREARLHAGVREGQAYAFNYLLSDSAILLVGTLTVFLLPQLLYIEGSVVVHAVVVICLIPIATMMRDFPIFSRADKASRRLAALRSQLARLTDQRPLAEPVESAPATLRQGLRLCGVEYHYPHSGDGEGFGIGPIDLEIPAGSITFIVGGNGSGKSTLMKLLTGLYRADAGCVMVDGLEYSAEQRRALFSIIFSDFHLFDRLYGLLEVDAERLDALLHKLEIGHKVHYTADGFSTLDLSTGQQKRVALAATLLEGRPVYLFDEWAADQDPEFRDYFYRELLPELKAEGKTVIAVTHDDRYFGLCDQRIEMEFGQVRLVERKERAGEQADHG